MTNKKTNSDQWRSKNDIAWETLFERYQILDIINKEGYFEIEATTINQERESRLMAKFDHSVNLPQIFKEHHLSILPVSRSKYVIGQFESYSKVEYKDLEPVPIDFPPWLESIDYTHLYSEASAIICAYNTGIIEDLIPGEQPKLTIFGRMSSSQFDFKINNLFKEIPYSILVNNAQCEIDAGFESDNYLILIEAKNYKVDDFLVRQLYYPFYKAFELTLSMGDIPSTKQIDKAIAQVRSDLKSTTINRRASTVKSWIKWIWNQISKD